MEMVHDAQHPTGILPVDVIAPFELLNQVPDLSPSEVAVGAPMTKDDIALTLVDLA